VACSKRQGATEINVPIVRAVRLVMRNPLSSGRLTHGPAGLFRSVPAKQGRPRNYRFRSGPGHMSPQLRQRTASTQAPNQRRVKEAKSPGKADEFGARKLERLGRNRKVKKSV
jgi:hypothetical protein